MTSAIAEPGLTFEVSSPEEEPTPLRSDVGFFLGRTSRGPMGVPTRLDGWRAFEGVFGGLWADTNTPYAVRGYFENGGQIAYVLRIPSATESVADASWAFGTITGTDQWSSDMPGGIDHEKLIVEAVNEGEWANGLAVELRYEREGPSGAPSVDLIVRERGEPSEHLVNLDHLRSVVGFRGYGQRDPLQEYKGESFELFQTMLANMREAVTAQMMRVELVQEAADAGDPEAPEMHEMRPDDDGFDDASDYYDPAPLTASRNVKAADRDPDNPNTWGKVGRNETCPCGSGKKFKHCHGAFV